MKSLRQMQMEMFYQHRVMPKDKDGYPMLVLCHPGIVSIISSKEKHEEMKRQDRVAFIVAAVVSVSLFVGIVLWS